MKILSKLAKMGNGNYTYIVGTFVQVPKSYIIPSVGLSLIWPDQNAGQCMNFQATNT